MTAFISCGVKAICGLGFLAAGVIAGAVSAYAIDIQRVVSPGAGME